jgi:hypothetical protein
MEKHKLQGYKVTVLHRMEEYERKWYIENKSGVSMKRRQNTIPRVKKLRAKYRKEHGDQWWADPDVKEEYIEEKKALSRKSSGTSASSSKKSKSTKKSRKSSSFDQFVERSAHLPKGRFLAEDDQAMDDLASLPKKIQKAFFAIQHKLEELPDSVHNDTGLFYDHVIDEGGVMLKIVLTDISRKPRLNVDFSDDIKVIKGRNVKEYKLSSTTPAFNYIKKWIESNSQKANPRRRKNSNVVKAAIQRSLDMPHFKNTFITRNPGPESEGSTFNRRQTPQSLMKAKWAPFSHPSIQAPAVGYSAPISGTMNLIKLTDLDPDTPVKMVLGHKGETPFVTALLSPRDIGIAGTPVDHTVILLGPGDDGNIVWTFFPGDPIQPSSTEPSRETRAAKTVEDAINLGFMYGKIAGK